MSVSSNSNWPDNFDFETDETCQNVFKPFIEAQLSSLKAFDAQREEWCATNMPSNYHVTYKFFEHTNRVAKDLRETVLHIGLGEKIANNLYWAMLPHDIGKKLLPVNIWDLLEKPEDDIKTLRRSHTDLGATVVSKELPETKHPFRDLMVEIMVNHHEQIDGGGFHGLEGEDLSHAVRLASIVESYDGWAIRRPHFGKRDTSPAAVLERMRTEKIHMFDKDLFEAFAEMKMKAYEQTQTKTG